MQDSILKTSYILASKVNDVAKIYQFPNYLGKISELN